MVEMANNVQELRPKAADSEKITINLGYVDLGHIDLLVREGFYANRTDFIRTAIRNQLDRPADATLRRSPRPPPAPSTSATSPCWCARGSTPTAPTSSAPPSATSSTATPTRPN